MKIGRIIAISLLCVGIPSCTLPMDRGMEEQWKVVYDNPEECALYLDNFLDFSPHTKRSEANYFLLRAIANDALYGDINTDEEAGLTYSTKYFSSHGPEHKEALSYYYLGRLQYLLGNYPTSIISLSKAESRTSDPSTLAYIHRYLAKAYNASLNSAEEVRYMKLSSENFASAGMIPQSGEALLQTGQAYYNLADYENAEKIYKSVLYTSHQNRDTLLESRTLSAYAALNLAKEEQDPVLSINMLARAGEQLGYPLSSLDKANLAYAYVLIGRPSQADNWLKEARKSFETPAEENTIRFREYQILSHEGKSSEALRALEDVMEYNTLVSDSNSAQSVLSSQRDFFEREIASSKEKLRSQRQTFLILILFIAIIIIAVFNYLRMQKLSSERELLEERTRNEDLMNIADDLQNRLQEEQKNSTGALSESFAVLERLCEQYYVYEGTDNLQPKILKEVGNVIDGLRRNPSMVEDILNRRRDNLMVRFRKELSSLKEDDIRLFCFTAAGLSTATISTLMEKDKQYIYNRLYRLKGRIASSSAPDKDEFLSIISK